MKIGLVYGSTTGNTEDAADGIRDQFAGVIDEVLEISSIQLASLAEYEVLLIGVSTWNIGELQQDWDYVFDDLNGLSFEGVRIGFFGMGDQMGYAENFQDAMGILRERLMERGARCDFGHWPTEGYEFTESLALVDDKFCGLSLDEDNQAELTEERILAWCQQIKRELGVNVEV